MFHRIDHISRGLYKPLFPRLENQHFVLRFANIISDKLWCCSTDGQEEREGGRGDERKEAANRERGRVRESKVYAEDFKALFRQKPWLAFSSTILFLLISPCSVYTLPLHLIRPSGCPLHFVTSRHRDGRVDAEGGKKQKNCQPPATSPDVFFFFLHNSPSVPLHPFSPSSFAPSLAPSQSQSRLTQALAGEASGIDPIKLVVGTARLQELSPKPSV